MNKVRVLRDHYHQMSVDLIGRTALGVRDGVYINYPLIFTTPPMTQTVFEGIVEDYEAKRSTYKNGGMAQKEPFTTAYGVLITSLDSMADMVDKIPSLTIGIVNDAGFVATKETDTEHPVPDGGRAIANLRNVSPGVIESECPVVEFAEFYHTIITRQEFTDTRIVDSKRLVFGKLDTFDWIDMTKGRKKTFEGLNSGTPYYVYYVIGNARGVSVLTEARRIICT
jgi:hypothetical protein